MQIMCFYVFSCVCDLKMVLTCRSPILLFLFVFEVSCRLSKVQVDSLYVFLRVSGVSVCSLRVFTCFYTPRGHPEPPKGPTEAQQRPRNVHRAHKRLPRGSPELPRLSPETPRGPTEAQRRPADAQQRPRRGPQWPTSCSKYAVYAVFCGVFACFPKHAACTFFCCVLTPKGFF